MFGNSQKSRFPLRKKAVEKKKKVWVSFIELDYNQIYNIKVVLKEKSKSFFFGYYFKKNFCTVYIILCLY